MLTDPFSAAYLFALLTLLFVGALLQEDNRRRRERVSRFRLAGEKMGPIAAAGLSGSVAGNAIREAIRRHEAELLAEIESEIVRRDDGAAQRASIYQELTIDTSAWDEAFDEVREDLQRFHRRVAAEVLRGAPVDTGELRSAVSSTRHLTPLAGSNVMPCCGRTPYEVSPYDELTMSEVLVTCPGFEGRLSRPAVGHGRRLGPVHWTTPVVEPGPRRRDRSDENDETFETEVLDRFGETTADDPPEDGLAVTFDPHATAPAWTSADDPPTIPEWQAWWTVVTYNRWREALGADEEQREEALLHVAEWYERPCDYYACPLCRPLRCRCDVDHETFRSSDPCEPCFEETVANRTELVVNSYQDGLTAAPTRDRGEEADPVLLVDGPLAGWIIGIRSSATSWESYVGDPFRNLVRVRYRRDGERRSLARIVEQGRPPGRRRASGSGHYEPPTEQYGPGVEDRRSTQLPEGCVADVWDDDEGYVPCGAEPDDGDLPFCSDHLARLRS